MKNENLLNVKDILVGNELVVLKGQLRNIQRVTKDDKSGEFYYLADLKVPRITNSASVYDTSFNMYHVCFSNEFISRNDEVSDEFMKKFKDNEVLMLVSILANINKSKSGDSFAKFNNVRFYVNEIVLLQSIDKPSFVPDKVLNL
jgi:hypothetical protein